MSSWFQTFQTFQTFQAFQVRCCHWGRRKWDFCNLSPSCHDLRASGTVHHFDFVFDSFDDWPLRSEVNWSKNIWEKGPSWCLLWLEICCAFDRFGHEMTWINVWNCAILVGARNVPSRTRTCSIHHFHRWDRCSCHKEVRLFSRVPTSMLAAWGKSNAQHSLVLNFLNRYDTTSGGEKEIQRTMWLGHEYSKVSMAKSCPSNAQTWKLLCSGQCLSWAVSVASKLQFLPD